MVYRWFVDRGCSVRYRPVLGGEIGQVGAHRSDMDRRLAWLLATVRPVVIRCLEHVGREQIEEILFGEGVIERKYGSRPVGVQRRPPIEHLKALE